MNPSRLTALCLAAAIAGASSAGAARGAGAGPFLTLGAGYEPQDYFSRISQQGNPVSVIRLGWCASALCAEVEHHSSIPLEGAGKERETNTIGLLLRYRRGPVQLQAGPALDHDRRLGGRYAGVARVGYRLSPRFSLDYEHLEGKQVRVNLFSIVATWPAVVAPP